MKKFSLWLLGVSFSVSALAFDDVPTSHPHYQAIMNLKSQGLIAGYADGTYRPDASINRVEFLKILAGLRSNLSTCSSYSGYSDAPSSEWYQHYLGWATCEELVEGYPDGTFRPGNSINYAEASKITLKSDMEALYPSVGSICKSDQYVPEGAPWYYVYTCSLESLGIKPNDTIEPADWLTRGQMAEMIDRVLEFKQTEISSDPPNILLIIADDFGLDATPWAPDYGAQKPNMPNLSHLSANGLIFTNLWSNPVCSPTRAGILTGKYGVHTGVLGPVSASDPGIGVDELSLQNYIAENSPHDYAQAIIGKWHLSTSNNGNLDNPSIMGVPYYSGLIGGGVQTYFDWKKVTNGKRVSEDEYITSVFTDEAIDWVGQQDSPWFLWLAYTAPHTPFHLPPADLISNYILTGDDIDENPLPYYLAAIEAMDREIGRLLASLSLEEQENTIIIFIGDNGSPGQVAQAPFESRKAKGSLYQGGINVPMFVFGPGVAQGQVDALVNTTDFFATIAELTGAYLPRHENAHSFKPVLFDQSFTPREWAYSEVNSTAKNGGPGRNNGWTIRDEQYKYIALDSGSELLFDLVNDPYETKNLSSNSDYADILQTLKTQGLSVRAK